MGNVEFFICFIIAIIADLFTFMPKLWLDIFYFN